MSAQKAAAAPAEYGAKHRFARITGRKARKIADLIRGRSVNEALELLEFAPQRGSSFYLKVVRSALANASQDENVNVNRLVISECRADDGPLLNNRMRFRPGPQGRAMPFAKRMSHLIVKVREVPEIEEAPEAEEAVGAKQKGKAGSKSAKSARSKSKSAKPKSAKSKSAKSKSAPKAAKSAKA